MKKTTTKVFHWIPRILGIVMVLFIGMFALDAFHPGLTVWQEIKSFLVQLIPGYIVLATVLIGWKWDIAGCFLCLTLALVYDYWALHHPIWILAISAPVFVLSLLFFISWYLKKKEKEEIVS